MGVGIGIHGFAWQAAAAANTAASYAAYLEAYPDGAFADDAQQRKTALLADDELFRAAIRAGSEEAVEAFVAKYPGHRREAEARGAVTAMQGRDIVDLIEEGKIEVKTAGSGIQNVELQIHKLVPYPVDGANPDRDVFRSAEQLCAEHGYDGLR